MNLFNRLLAIIFGIGIIPVIPTAIFLFYYQSVAKNNILTLHENLSEMASIVVEREFSNIKRSVSERLLDKKPSDFKKKDDIEKFLSRDKNFLFAALLNSEGTEISAGGALEIKRRFGFVDFSKNRIFLKTKKRDKISLGGFEILYDNPIMTVIAPLADKKAYLMCVISLKDVLSKLSSREVGIAGKVYLADLNGNILKLTKSIPVINSEDLKKFFESGRKSSKSISANKDEYIGGFSLIKIFSMSVLILQNKWQAFRGINLITWLIAFFLLVILTVFYFAALFLSRRIMSPINELMEGSKRVSDKNFKKLLSEKSDFTEFSSLMKSFNQMMKEMDKYQSMQVEKIISEKRKVDLLMSIMHDAVILSDFRGVPVYLNNSAKEILNMREFGEEAGRDKVCEIVKRKTKSDILDFQIGEKRKFYKVSIELVPSKTEKPGIFIIMKDITVEHELGKMKEDFFHSVAHDIRIPLLTMQGYIKLLENSCESEKNLNYVGNIKNSSEQLFDFLQNILDISRFEAGSMKLDLAEVSVKNLIGDAVKRFEILCDEKKIEIRTSVSREKLKVVLDENLFRRVLDNIVSNAVKFTPSGGKIEIKAEIKNKNLEIAVSDTGCGIPLEQVKKIFEKYVQVSAEDRKKKGSGLGLAIAKKIVEAHRGKIWVESELEKGSVFHISVSLL